jgi:uncharacterized phage protein gp47/JayE
MSVTFGLSDQGFTAPREADFLELIRDDYKARLAARGLPSDIDFDADVFLGNITANMAARLGKAAGDGLQALYDAFDPSGATGLQLDNLSVLVGVPREEPTASQATVTYTGTVGTPVLAGEVVEGGGVDDDQKWTVSADVVIGGGGTVDVVVVAQQKGAVVATAGQIDKIVTLKAGLDSVTNAADATTGQARETDSELRKRRQESLQISGGRNNNALRAQLTALASVIAAVVVDNDTDTQVVNQGIILEPHSVAVVIHPSTLTTAQKKEVALVIFDQITDGIFTNGTDVVATVTKLDTSTKTIRWDFADLITTNNEVTVVLDDGVALGDVDEAVKAAVVDYYLSLGVGDDVRRLPQLALVDEIDGILDATVKIDAVDADKVITLAQLAVIGTNAVIE